MAQDSLRSILTSVSTMAPLEHSWIPFLSLPLLSFRSYNPIYSDPKPTHEKRQTRGKNNKLPSEIISLHANNPDKDLDDPDNLGSDFEDGDGAKDEDDEFSIFNIEIAQILWRRNRENSDEDEYLVKYRGRSYFHTEWLTEE